MKCRNCNQKIIKFFSLGKSPLGNGFLKSGEFSSERKYDLGIGFCPNCYLVQLIKIVPLKKLYGKTFYFPSTFKSILEESKKMVICLVRRLNLESESTVLDIGCSDGYQLLFFKKFGMKILGVDPAWNSAEIAYKKNIPTIVDFFSYKLAKKLKRKKFQADLIISTHLLNHIATIKDFLEGIKLLLKPKGTVFLKFFIQKELDIITHEHIFYFSFLSLNNVLKNADLEIYNVAIKQGTLTVFATHVGVFPISKNLRYFISKELEGKFDKLETYQKFADNIMKTKKELVGLLKNLKNRGKRIAAYSAPEKGNILLNYCGIGKNYLDFIVDKSELKQGLYTPGTHLLVYPPEKIYQEKPDYLLILSWNIADEIRKRLKDFHDAGGKFIIPIPKIKMT